MKVAIMQPYFFPYIGYFQLINAVDIFVIYDDVNFIKGGWINRNRILLNGKAFLINIPVEGTSSFKPINQISIGHQKEKILKTIHQAYSKAPFYSQGFKIVEKIILADELNLAKLIQNSIVELCQYLNIDTDIRISSQIDKNNSLKGKDKVLDICHKLRAQKYINAIGGQALYSKEDFRLNGLELNFINSQAIEYKQFNHAFIPWLSIIDVLMFNSKEKIQGYLNMYDLL